MFIKTREDAEEMPLRDKVLRASDTRFRIFAGTTASEMFTCWGERLLLRMADRELQRMKSQRGKTVRTEVTYQYASIR